MRLSGKLVEDLVADDVQALIDNEISETRLLEFKRQLPGDSAEDRRKFVASASAIANTSGGVIVFGLKCRYIEGRDAGIADEVLPLDAESLDVQIQRLESMLRTSVNPSMAPHVAFGRIPWTGGGTVLALGIRRSLVGPHMATSSGSHRIYRRGETGKYEPDVTELRRMFLKDREWTTEIEQFQRARLARLESGEIPIPSLAPACVLHVLPLGRLREMHDVRDMIDSMRGSCPPLGDIGGYSTRFNFDGIITRDSSSTCRAFAQLFRFGGLELYTADYFRDHDSGGNNIRFFFAVEFRLALLGHLRDSISMLTGAMSVDPPFAVTIRVLRARDALIPTTNGWYSQGVVPLGLDHLPLPSIQVDDPQSLEESLGPAFDVLWQASGYDGAPPIQA